MVRIPAKFLKCNGAYQRVLKHISGCFIHLYLVHINVMLYYNDWVTVDYTVDCNSTDYCSNPMCVYSIGESVQEEYVILETKNMSFYTVNLQWI